MSIDIVRLHGLIQYYRAINAWGMAQDLEKILISMRSEIEKDNVQTKKEVSTIKKCA